MPLSLQDRQNRYLIQAQWTRALRLYFFQLLNFQEMARVLDMGCGTGALLPDLQALTPAHIYGADILEEHLRIAQETCPECSLTGADVHTLPYQSNTFDLVLSHFFLMWIGTPGKALKEMRRIIKPGGYLVAFAEPDYGGRIDYPPEFNKIRDYQISGLLKTGADPRLGRKLRSLFHEVGLTEIQTGVYDGGWGELPSPNEIESEWQVLEDDLAKILSPAELQELKKHELSAWENGSRLIYVPTFYAWGIVTK
ncbi:MAG: methyltransferase domain-containing protein [Anaerolineales bacterium]|nr:methyltransferase domain-containing protein [Anaerolineales bacterium]